MKSYEITDLYFESTNFPHVIKDASAIFHEFAFILSFLSTALKSHGKSATFRQHYYPEGAWGWVITFCCFLVNIFTYGLQFSYALLELEVVEHCHAHLTPTSPYAASVAAGYDNSALFAGAGLSTGFGGANVGWGEVTTGAGYGGVTGVGADVAEVEEANAKDQLRLNAGTNDEIYIPTDSYQGVKE